MVSPASRAVGKASSTLLTLRPGKKKTNPPLADVTLMGKKNKITWLGGGGGGQPPASPPGAGCWATVVVAFGSGSLLHPVKRSEGCSALCKCYSGPPKPP